MKPYIISLALMATLMPMADAETIWAKGVSLEGGWVDINKAVNGNQWADETEGSMCYAAAAVNLIAWWQQQYNNIPAGTPNTAAEIWNVYKHYGNHGGGNTSCALQWWLTGIYSDDQNFSDSKNTGLTTRTYLYFDQDAVLPDIQNFICYSGTNSLIEMAQSEAGLSASIVDALNSGKGLSLTLSGNFTHSVTLWGVDIDETGQITKIWLTDSDDARADLGNYSGDSIFSVDVENVTKKANNQTFTTLKLTGNDGERGYEGCYISSIFGIDPTVSDNWGLIRAASDSSDSTVPEPATATLSLLALAGMALRRRRK